MTHSKGDTGIRRAGQAVPHRADWRFVEKLGAGAFGEVWRIWQPQTERDEAIKFAMSADAAELLRSEAAAMRVLANKTGGCPHIIRITGTNLGVEPTWIAMEYAAGGSLADRLGLGELPVEELRLLFSRICGALAAAHESGIVHGDVKPPNILLMADGTPRLSDFGLGTLLDAADHTASAVANSALQTRLAGPGGTPLFLSPERAAGALPVAADDVFALGVTLMQALTGDPLAHPQYAGVLLEAADDSLRRAVLACVGPRRMRPSARQLQRWIGSEDDDEFHRDIALLLELEANDVERGADDPLQHNSPRPQLDIQPLELDVTARQTLARINALREWHGSLMSTQQVWNEASIFYGAQGRDRFHHDLDVLDASGKLAGLASLRSEVMERRAEQPPPGWENDSYYYGYSDERVPDDGWPEPGIHLPTHKTMSVRAVEAARARRHPEPAFSQPGRVRTAIAAWAGLACSAIFFVFALAHLGGAGGNRWGWFFGVVLLGASVAIVYRAGSALRDLDRAD
ncbi:MAG: serine/threonine-protein kinase [Planctomycetota bacterium]